MFGYDSRSAPPEDVAQNQCRDDRIVERACDRDELRDQVERRDDPHDREPDQSLRPARDARVAQQTAEEYDEVRQERRELAGGRTSPRDREPGYRDDPHTDQHEDRDQPAGHRHPLTGPTNRPPSTSRRTRCTRAGRLRFGSSSPAPSSPPTGRVPRPRSLHGG